MDVYFTYEAPCPVVHLKGDIDTATRDLVLDSLGPLISGGHERIVLDFSAVTFLDSSGIGALLAAAAGMQPRRLALASPQPQVARLLSLSGLGALIEVWDTIHLAKAGKAEGAAPLTPD